MKFLPALFGSILLLMIATASAQSVRTWISPASTAGSYTNIITADQVLEILSASYDTDSEIDIDIEGQSLTLGTGGANLTLPFVIAGPATITYKKNSTGGTGMIVTYRVTPQQ